VPAAITRSDLGDGWKNLWFARSATATKTVKSPAMATASAARTRNRRATFGLNGSMPSPTSGLGSALMHMKSPLTRPPRTF